VLPSGALCSLALLVAEISITRAGASARYALPSDRHYLMARHVWAQMQDGVATIGVTAPLGEMLWFAPEVTFWAVERVDEGQTLATVQGRSGRTVVIGSPVSGSVVALNDLLERAPHALLAQPYGRGWVARVVPDSWDRDHAAMTRARSYRAALDAELPIGREFCFGGALLPGPWP
jgi:glycine cleavage system H protein